MKQDTSVVNLNTSLIIPNKYQPRKVFDEQSLKNLSESIGKYGIINPILVRKKEDKYEIIAGERRFRAAKNIGLSEVPVIIKDADEQQMAELALIENIQRQGLSPIEEAKSYEEIMRIGNQTQSSLAERIGKSQSYIANKIRLLSLPVEIQEALAHKKISERHARSLLNLDEKAKQLELLERIIKERLTVKETEQIINEKEINEEEIKQAISDIMKSLNIKEEEKEDDNMNNGNFFPNYDNNAVNNNASLNMMNMQSMNQAPIAPEPEVVMPTMGYAPETEPQLVTPQETVMPGTQPINLEVPVMPQPGIEPAIQPTMPTIEMPASPEMSAPMINNAPLFGPVMETPQPVVSESTPNAVDVPLFNPNVTIPNPLESPLPTLEPVAAPAMPTMEPVMPEPVAPVVPSFEVPVTEPIIPTPIVEDKLTKLKDLLNANGYTYKVYNNETDNCVIIELPRN